MTFQFTKPKIVNQTFYVVRVGGRLYVQSGFDRWYPAKTEDVLRAKRFLDAASAEQVASKTMGGEVVCIHITEGDTSTDEDDIEMMERTIDKLTRKNKRLKQQLQALRDDEDEDDDEEE